MREALEGPATSHSRPVQVAVAPARQGGTFLTGCQRYDRVSVAGLGGADRSGVSGVGAVPEPDRPVAAAAGRRVAVRAVGEGVDRQQVPV